MFGRKFEFRLDLEFRPNKIINRKATKINETAHKKQYAYILKMINVKIKF